jgi:hypothetical protein
LAYQRHKAQAIFRNEQYLITEDYWNEIWTEERFRLRGMRADCLCLTRRDFRDAWRPGNLALLTRQQQLNINNKAINGIDYEHLFETTIWNDYE